MIATPAKYAVSSSAHHEKARILPSIKADGSEGMLV